MKLRPLIWMGNSLLGLRQRVWSSYRGKYADDFIAHLAEFHDAKGRLESSSGGLEARFLTTSNELVELAQSSREFVTQVERLVSLATGKGCDETIFSNAIRLVEDSTSYLARCERETSHILNQLRGYRSQIEGLKSAEADIQRTMLPLKFVQTLFKSESAPLGAAVQQMFGALTQEMEGLHNQVRDIFGTKFKQLEETRKTIDMVIVKLENQDLVLHQIIANHKARIESSLRSLKNEMSSNEERDVRLHRLSKEFAQQVEQVVVGLQFGDIITQKLQHVVDALPQIETKLKVLNSSSPKNEKLNALHFLNQSCPLEAGQIQSAQEELINAEFTIQSGVKNVVTQLTEMDSRCLSMEEFKMLTTSFDGMVQVLVEMIEEVRTLVDRTVANATEAYDILRPLGVTTSDLTGTVRGMAARIHLIGLNSQIQASLAAQDQRGSGLEVLSARTREISDETNRLGEAATLQLDSLAAGLVQTVREFGDLRDKGLEHQTHLSHEDRKEEQQLHAFRDNALEALIDISNSFDNIRQKSQQTLDTVQFSDFYLTTLPRVQNSLLAIGVTAKGALASKGNTEDHTGLIEHLTKNYTMASERKVFTNLASGRSPSPTPPSTFRKKPKTEVEVFVDLPPKQTPITQELAPSTVTIDGDLGSNVELF